MTSGVSKRVGDALALYNDERKQRSRLIENGRKTMEEIMKKVEDIENRRAGIINEQDDVEEIPVETRDDENTKLQTTQENASSIVHQEAANVQDDDDETDDSSFALWLRSISQCLSNKISADPVVMPAEEEEEDSDEDLDEDTRCMRYVLSYFVSTKTKVSSRRSTSD